MIRAEAVTVRAGGVDLLDRVSFDVAGGEVAAVVGPNGAGKSTLLAVLAGDRAPSSGHVHLHGHAVSTLRPTSLARLRAVLPQASSLTAAFTAVEVVMLAQDAGSELERRERGRRRLEEVELGDVADRLYPSLSGGERQRVHLARVLEHLGDGGDRALLLDEPTAALDLRHQHLVLRLARRAAEQGHAVIAALHDLSLAARYADRVVLLDHGRLVACGHPDEVLRPEILAPVFDIDVVIVRGPDGAVLILPGLPRSIPRSGTERSVHERATKPQESHHDQDSLDHSRSRHRPSSRLRVRGRRRRR